MNMSFCFSLHIILCNFWLVRTIKLALSFNRLTHVEGSNHDT